MRKFVQMVPKVGAAFKKMFEIVESHGIDLAASDQYEPTLHYLHWEEMDDEAIEVTIYVSATFWSKRITGDDGFPPEKVGTEINYCHTICGIEFGLGLNKLDTFGIEVTYDPLEEDGWMVVQRANIHDQVWLSHPIWIVMQKFARHFGIEEKARPLCRREALKVVEALATCFPKGKETAPIWGQIQDGVKLLTSPQDVVI